MEPAATVEISGKGVKPGGPDSGAGVAPANRAGGRKQGALGAQAARGVSFMMVQGLATRVFAFLCQMALAYLLLPEHFGLIAMAETVVGLANLLQLIGVREVLVGRHEKTHLYGNAAFWITGVTGLAAALIVAAAAPIAARVYGSPELLPFMLALATAQPIHAMCVASDAKLQADLRFKRLAFNVGVTAASQPAIQVVGALLGMGAYSYILARLGSGVIRFVLAMWGCGLKLRWSPQVRRWKYIVSSSGAIFATSVLILLTTTGDRALLGIFVDDRQVGLYSFAYALSLQTIMLICNSLDGVLFATMAKLNAEPTRQLHAFQRASRALAMIVVPMCVIQAVVSDAAVHTVFPYEKWKHAIPAMQILGVGMLFLGAYGPAVSLMAAQQRFRTRLVVYIVHALVYGALVVLGVLLGRKYLPPESGGVTGAATGVAMAMALIYPVWCYAATRRLGGHAHEVVRIIARPLAATLLSCGIGLLAGELAARGLIAVGQQRFEHWARLLVIGGTALAVYAPIARLIMPREFTEIAVKILAVGRRISPAAAARTAAIFRIEGVGSPP